MSTSFRPANTTVRVKKRLGPLAVKNFNKKTADADRAEKIMRLQEEKIEKGRKLFLRRHETLTRSVEKDLKDLRSAQQKFDEERQRRKSYCMSLEKLQENGNNRVTNDNVYEWICSNLSHQEKLLFGLRSYSYSDGLPLIKTNSARNETRRYEEKNKKVSKDSAMAATCRKSASLPTIHILCFKSAAQKNKDVNITVENRGPKYKQIGEGKRDCRVK